MKRMASVVAIAAAIAGCSKKKDAEPASGTAAPAPAAAPAKAEAPKPAPAPAPAGKVEVALPAAVKLQPPAKVQLGARTVTSEPCKLDKRAPDMKDKDFSDGIRDLAVGPDGALYVVDDQHKIRKYVVQSASPCELALDTTWGQNGLLAVGDLKTAAGIESVAFDAKGNLYASGDSLHRLGRDGKDTPICGDQSGRLVIDPSTGASYVGWHETLTMTGDTCATAPLPALDGLAKDASVQVVDATAGLLFVSTEVGDVHKVGVYGQDGKKTGLWGEKDGDQELCTVETAAPCSGGFCVVDGNCRKLVVWGADGKVALSTDLNALLGASYVWPKRLVVAKDAAWIAYTQGGENAPDDEQHFGLISRITGL
jgi:hypothetical protein